VPVRPFHWTEDGMSNERVKVTVGVCGGIAAYKSVELVRLLQDAGYDPHVVMTKAAEFWRGGVRGGTGANGMGEVPTPLAGIRSGSEGLLQGCADRQQLWLCHRRHCRRLC
jgi:hypothetical protein